MKKRLLFAMWLLACGDPQPRYGEATLSSGAPRAALSGTTFGQAAALELAPGCAGYLDPETPAHIVHVNEPLAFAIRVRSDVGPLALAVARDDEVRCDSDEGSGHAPTLELEGAGDYAVYVAALRAPAELPYTLEVNVRGTEADAPPVASNATRDVNVTITSQPPGATVRDADRVLGTTPAMFVVSGAANEEKSWTLELDGHESVTVGGRLASAALVLHAQLVSAGPSRIELSASDPQPIRDYQTATLAVDVPDDCAISEAEIGVDIRHPFIGDLRLVLHPPSGEDVVLHNHGGGGRRNLQRTWNTTDRALSSIVGRSTRGRWALVVHDDAGADQGSFERFDLRLTCGSAIAGNSVEPARDEEPRFDPPNARNPTPRLPELPTHADIVAVLARLRPSVEQRCAQGGGNVRIYFTLAGSSGSVRGVNTSGAASPAEQSCVAQVVRGARFPRFRRDSLDVDYTYDLPARRPPSP